MPYQSHTQDPEECGRRRLSFFAYQLLLPDESTPAGATARRLHTSHWQDLQWLAAHGFPTSPDNRLCPSFEQAVDEAEKWMGTRDQLGV